MIVNKYQGNGGGGGGSYVLPTATANRLGGIKVGSGLTVENDGTLSTSGSTYELPVASDQVLGGVKVGSGLTIDATGMLSVSGGTAPAGGGDYMVVSGLPATAQEGQLFFVPAHIENVLYRTYAFDCSGMYQNEVESYVLPEYALNEKTLYYQWNNGDYGWFHWDWGENEHDWVEIPGWGWYKVGEGDYTFYAKVPDGSVNLSDVNEYVSVDSSVTETVQISVAPATYRYTGNAFRKEVVKIKINDFKGADYGFNSDNLYNYLQQFAEEELKQNFVFEYDGKYAKYSEYNESSEPEYTTYIFEVRASSVLYPIGTPTVSPIYSVFVYTDGHTSTDGQNETNIFLPIRMSVNVVDSGLTCQNSGSLWTRVTDRTWGGNPFVVVIYDSENDIVLGYTQNCWLRQAYDGDNSDWVDMGMDAVKIFGAEWYQYGDKITAEWVVNSEGNVVGGAPINWTVTSVHSAADSTIPSSNE